VLLIGQAFHHSKSEQAESFWHSCSIPLGLRRTPGDSSPSSSASNRTEEFNTLPIQTDVSAANHVVIRVTGKLAKDELTQFRKDFESFVKERGKLRILFDVTEFDGWDSGGALWQEARFDFKHLSDIDRLAMVGAKRWQQALEAAVKRFAHPTMRYFEASEMQAAHDWLISK
jgi:hypothetical protein